MSCGGRVYKGDTITISVPFDVDDYSNLTITYTTIGDEKIVKTQEEVEIEDGFIIYTFEPGELDLLPDGVIYYTIECEVLGVPNVDSTNTNLYLKTPAGYSGRTAEDIYQEGYEAGLEDCSGSTDCSSAVTQAYQSGYTAGLEACSGSTCNIQPLKSVVPQFDNYPIDYQMDIYPDEGYDGLGSVSIDKRQLYDQGYQAGLEDCSGSSCNLQTKSVVLTASTQTVLPSSGYDGMSSVSIDADTYAQEMFDQGYDSGYEDAEEEYPRIQIAKNYTANTLSAVIVPDTHYDGMGKVNLNATPVFNSGYLSGYTAASGVQIQPQKTYSLHLNQAQWYVFPDEGYDGVAEVIIKDDVGYGENKYASGYSAGLAACSGGCNLSNFVYSINGGWGGGSRFYPQDYGVDGWSEIYFYDNGYGNKRYRDGYEKAERDSSSAITEAYQSGYTAGLEDCSGSTDCSSAITEAFQSGYTEGYNEAITANCGSAITEAYSSGVTVGEEEAKGSIFSVEIKFGISGLAETGYTSQVGYPPLYIIDTDGNSHQLNYIYSESPKKVHHIVDTTDEGGGTNIVTEQWAGYLQDGAKYITPHQVIMYTAESNTDTGKTIVGQSIRFNGEVIHNWQTGPYGDVYDDWSIGDGGWKFATTDTEIGDLYIDTSYHNVRFKGLIFTI